MGSRQPPTLRITDAAWSLGVHPDTLRNWEASGVLLPDVVLGGQRRYSPRSLVEFARRQAVAGTSEHNPVFARNPRGEVAE